MQIRSKFLVPAVFLPLLALPVQADPEPVGMEFQVNTYTPDEQDTPVVAAAPDGGFVVAWESYDQDMAFEGIFVRRFDAEGQPLGDEMQANTNTAGNQEDASVAVGDDGSFVVVWDADNAADGEARGIFGRRFDSSGSPVGDEFGVNVFTTGDQNDPVVAMMPDGGFVVAWETELAMDPTDEDLVGLRFDSMGSPVGDEFEINTTMAFDQEDLAIGTDAVGNFVVVWESYAQDGLFDGIIGRRFDSGGNALGDEFVVNTYTIGDQADPALSVAADGSFVVAWEDFDIEGPDEAVMGRFYDSSGNPAGEAFQMDVFADGLQRNPSVALTPNGAVAAWQSLDQDGAGGSVVVRSFDSDGVPRSDELVVNTTTMGFQGYPWVAQSEDRFLVVWEDGASADGSLDGVFGQVFKEGLFADGFESGDTSGWSSVSP